MEGDFLFGTTVLQFDSENRSVKIYDINILSNSRNTRLKHNIPNIYDITDIGDIKSFIKGKRLIAIYEGEEVYIRFLKLPHVRKGAIDNLINHELNFIFKNIDDISYTYEILRRTKKEMELMVFCINTDKNRMLEKYFNRNIIRGVFLIQSFFISYIFSQIENDTFICTFIYGSHLYIAGCLKGKTFFNNIIRNFDGNLITFTGKLQIAQDKFSQTEIKYTETRCITIYFLNFDYKSVFEETSKKYNCISLGKIDEKDLISSLLPRRTL